MASRDKYRATTPGHLGNTKAKPKPDFARDIGCLKAKDLGYMGPCVECTLPKCLEDKESITQAKKRAKDANVVRLFRDGKSAEEIAKMLGIGYSTVQLALKRLRWKKSKDVSE